MGRWLLRTLYSFLFMQICMGESGALRGPPKVETNPKFSSSYIPAAMQIIAHDTELMKYVIRPPPGITTTTTTTMRPTPSHRPALFGPSKPLGPSAYFSKDNLEGQYVQLQQQPSGSHYFDRYPAQQGRTLQEGADIYAEVDNYLGKSFGDVLRLANRIDDDLGAKDEDTQVLEFSKGFEDKDSTYRYELLRQKRVPPAKAYVTMLSLYDQLNKESKRLMLNKFSGYNDDVLKNLVAFSSSTSSYQLRSTLNKLVENGDTTKEDVVGKIKKLIADLDQEGSYINEALKDIPPLVFAQ